MRRAAANESRGSRSRSPRGTAELRGFLVISDCSQDVGGGLAGDFAGGYLWVEGLRGETFLEDGGPEGGFGEG